MPKTSTLKGSEPRPPKRFAFVYGEDWEGIYVDGKLAYEGHMVPAAEVLAVLGIEYDDLPWSEKQAEEDGKLPKDLKDVKLAEN